jgi:hypothetical protein
LYGACEDEQKKVKCLQIAERNGEIAIKNYGELNIYTLKTELDLVTNNVT